MITGIQIFFCIILSIISIGLAEVLFHKYLFHKKIKLIKYITELWNYPPEKHTEHHKICYGQMEDLTDNDHDYWVQRPSNVSIAGLITYSVQLCILWAIGMSWPFFVLSAALNVITFTFWLKFEDHFHLAMHKNHYYMKKIHGTWQDPWFKYAKRLHAIHHRNPRYNYGFVFFPIGDLLLGSYCHSHERLSRKKEYSAK